MRSLKTIFRISISCISIFCISGWGDSAPGLLSITGTARSTASADSLAPLLAPDGSRIAFLSLATDLTTNFISASGSGLQLFTRRVGDPVCELASAAADGSAANAPVDGFSFSPDGGILAFATRASNLTSGDNNRSSDIFFRDLKTGVTRRVLAADGAEGNADSVNPQFSADGRFIFFESHASNMTPGGRPGTRLLRYEPATGSLRATDSIANGRPDDLTLPIFQTAISADGGLVVFAPRIPAVNGTNPLGTNQLHLWNVTNGTIRELLIAPGPGKAASRVISSSFSLSEDGRKLVFQGSRTSPSFTNAVYIADLITNSATNIAPTLNTATRSIEPEFGGPWILKQGSLVFFEGRTNNFTNGVESVYSWDLSRSKLELISTGITAPGIIPSSQPPSQLVGASRNGTFIAFLAAVKTTATAAARHPVQQLFVKNLSTSETRLISRTPRGEPAEDCEFPSVSFSDDGNRLVFQSIAADLTPEDINLSHDVFLYDWTSDTLSLISSTVQTHGNGQRAGLVLASSITSSADGSHIAFTSASPKLVPGDSNGGFDVFVRDLSGGTNVLVSAAQNSRFPGNGSSLFPSISADGRWVAFTSTSSNLAPGDTNRTEDVYLRDLQSGTTRLVSRAVGPDPLAAGNSLNAVINPDATLIAFVSSATNLVANPPPGTHIYLFETATGNIRLADNLGDGSIAARTALWPVFSPDGRWLFFRTDASAHRSAWDQYALHLASGRVFNLTPRSFSVRASVTGGSQISFSADGRLAVSSLRVQGSLVLLHDLSNVESPSAATLIATNGVAATMDGAGRRVVWQQNTGVTVQTQRPQVWMLDLQSGDRRLVSRAAGSVARANNDSYSPTLSRDGTHVFFASRASNLIPSGDDDNGQADVFAHNLETGATTLISRVSAGRPGSRLSTEPVGVPDAGRVIFTSFAPELSSPTGLWEADVFIADVGTGAGPLLRITHVATGHVTLFWNSDNESVDRIEFAERLDPASWRPLASTINESAGTRSMTDATQAASTRFYRLIRTRR